MSTKAATTSCWRAPRSHRQSSFGSWARTSPPSADPLRRSPVRPQSCGSRGPCQGERRIARPPGARAPLPLPLPSTDSTRQTRAPRRRQARALARAHLEGRSQGRRLRTPRPHRPPRGALPCPVSAAAPLLWRFRTAPPSTRRHRPDTCRRQPCSRRPQAPQAYDLGRPPHEGLGHRRPEMSPLRRSYASRCGHPRTRRDHRYPRGRPLGQVDHKGQRTSRGGTSARERRGLTVPVRRRRGRRPCYSLEAGSAHRLAVFRTRRPRTGARATL